MNLRRISDKSGGKAGEHRTLDIRSPRDFQAGHLPGAVSHPVSTPPVGLTLDRHVESVLPSIFLPPREMPLLVVGTVLALTEAVASHLAERGRASVTAVTAAELPAGSLTELGPSRAHLWGPPPWLASHEAILPPPVSGPVLDLACGSGRAAVWLAERGYRVTGIDWQPEALALGSRLAASRDVAVALKAVDLREPTAVPTGPWAVVLNFRYLQRDLLARFESLVQPGGLAVVRTFRDAPGYEGHPKPRHRLAPGELLRSFPAGKWRVLAHETSHDTDRRPAEGIVARRVLT